MKKLAILGASGHGKVIADAAESLGWAVEFFDDGVLQGSHIGAWTVQGNTDTLLDRSAFFSGVVIGIGHNKTRLEKAKVVTDGGMLLATIIHPNASVSQYSKVCPGSVVLSGAVVSVDAILGSSCIVNTGATVDHDCNISAGVHISPGAHVAGGVTIGEGSWIGIGASIKESITIGSGVIVGAGSTVLRDIPRNMTVVGSPAKPIN
jgi:sugar O-acyltransferase (sialic acid O-acetyltransferase NeuD family)